MLALPAMILKMVALQGRALWHVLIDFPSAEIHPLVLMLTAPMTILKINPYRCALWHVPIDFPFAEIHPLALLLRLPTKILKIVPIHRRALWQVLKQFRFPEIHTLALLTGGVLSLLLSLPPRRMSWFIPSLFLFSEILILGMIPMLDL